MPSPLPVPMTKTNRLYLQKKNANFPQATQNLGFPNSYSVYDYLTDLLITFFFFKITFLMIENHQCYLLNFQVNTERIIAHVLRIQLAHKASAVESIRQQKIQNSLFMSIIWHIIDCIWLKEFNRINPYYTQMEAPDKRLKF